MNNLAEVLETQGKYEEAELMHRQTLELREKVLSIKHLDTLTSVNNLAVVLEKQGKYEEGKGMHQEALELREKTLGQEPICAAVWDYQPSPHQRSY
jgi:tetratricopeptide (TPR) repeat protein